MRERLYPSRMLNYSKTLPKLVTKIFHCRKSSQDRFLTSPRGYFHRDAILGAIITDPHSNYLSAAIASHNDMIEKILVCRIWASVTVDVQAEFPHRISVTQNI
jgi:hypothetical protein